MTGTTEDPASIVRFWNAVEIFRPQPVEDVNRVKRVYAVSPDEPLPWEPEHRLAGERLRPGKAWRHLVYLGVYSLNSVFEVLARVCDPDEESYDPRPTGMSALAAFLVDGDGRPVPDSVTLSSCAWATGRAVCPGPDRSAWLDGFENAEAEFAAELERIVEPFVVQPDDTRDERGRSTRPRLDRDAVEACRDAAAEAAGVRAVLAHQEIRVRSTTVSLRGTPNADTHDFLNSFATADLLRVADQTDGEPPGAALREFLRPDTDIDAGARVDVRERQDVVLNATAPAEVPLGRWPRKPDQPLALGQQIAVNGVRRMADLDGGIFAVNGPPGTGKTTMLRDIVAATVVERARRLAELTDPRQAFTGRKHRWKTVDYTRLIHEWDPSLTGFEMVVASSNNGAVANVTNEIPTREAIDECWRTEAEQLDYFPAIAEALLTDDEPARPGAPTAAGAWALVAAKLGRKSNRNRFVNDFWFGPKTTPTHTAGEADAPTGGENSTDSVAEPRMRAVLRGFEESPPSSSWREAVADFRRALDAAAFAQADRTETFTMLVRHGHAESAAQAAIVAADRARREAVELHDQYGQASATAASRETGRERLLTRRIDHRRFRPGWFERLFRRRAARRWRERDEELAAAVSAAEHAIDQANDMVTHLVAAVDRANAAAARLDDQARLRRQELAALTGRLDVARAAPGAWLPDQSWWNDRPRRELAAPWTDLAWNQSRTELFFAALRLHKAFLTHMPREMRESLSAAMDIVGGAAPRGIPEAAALEAWRALFFVVPIISTTFASLPRLFSHLGAESLGWLLIDEAGQASPQAAVGALWRARHAVVVGDPLQLEPVATVPFRVEQLIRREHGVDEQWLPSQTSAQRLADRSNPLGTWLPGDDGRIWVGAPLTVHRRCDEPMFSIVNDVVYDSLMIDGTFPAASESFAASYPSLPASKWIDVAADEAQGHWIPAEGRQVERILTTLESVGIAMSDIMVVGPFTDIASNLAPYRHRYPGLSAGTIHTAQGKEADIVVLVLGGDPRRPGAKGWAASKPNLLNVAVSRAKRRIYVIGNRDAWAAERYFDHLAHRLPSTPAR